MAAVADVDGQLAIFSVEDSVTGVALHVVSGFVEVSHPGDVILPGFSHDLTGVGDDDGRVPDDVSVVTFQNGTDDHHVMSRCVLIRYDIEQKWLLRWAG